MPVIPLLCSLTCGEISAGPANTWGRGAPVHGASTDIRWRTDDANSSPYVELLAGRVNTLTIGAETRLSKGRFYFEPGVGLAVHWGDGRRDFGSVGLFQFTGAVGYKLNDRAAIEAYASHWSNGFLAKPDRGLNAVGARLVWRY